jgi:hypothetical protein
MQPGDLRRFRDSLIALGADHVEGSTFMVLRVNDRARREGYDNPRLDLVVDILIDGGLETDLGYSWVEDSSEVISEAG